MSTEYSLCTPFFGQFQLLNIRENYRSTGDEFRFKLNSKFPVSQSTTFVSGFFANAVKRPQCLHSVCPLNTGRYREIYIYTFAVRVSFIVFWVVFLTPVCVVLLYVDSIDSALPMVWHTITIFRIQVLLLIKQRKFIASNF